MGLLDKTNPHATPRSVLQWALGGAVVGSLAALFHASSTDIPVSYLPLLAPSAALLGAGLGGLIEWQYDDEDEEGEDGQEREGEE